MRAEDVAAMAAIWRQTDGQTQTFAQLGLTNNRLGPAGGRKLAIEFMRERGPLNALYLSKNALGPEGGASLATCTDHLLRLSLNFNALSDTGALPFARFGSLQVSIAESLQHFRRSFHPAHRCKCQYWLNHQTADFICILALDRSVVLSVDAASGAWFEWERTAR